MGDEWQGADLLHLYIKKIKKGLAEDVASTAKIFSLFC